MKFTQAPIFAPSDEGAVVLGNVCDLRFFVLCGKMTLIVNLFCK